MNLVTDADCIPLRELIILEYGKEIAQQLSDEDIRMFGEFLLACAGITPL